MIKQYVKTSILNTELKYIAHGVNCRDVMGSGIAKVLFDKYPNVKSEYHQYFQEAFYPFHNPEESYELLGRVQKIDCVDKVIFNCFTQNYYGTLNKQNPGSFKYVSYDAVYDCFRTLVSYGIKDLAIPKIGCGLAGGNWDVVSKIIDNATQDKLNVYVYHLD